MRTLLFFILAATLFVCGVNVFADNAKGRRELVELGEAVPFSQLVRKVSGIVRPSVVSVFIAKPAACKDMPGEPYRTVGSGVIFDKRGYVLTNYHVIHLAGENKLSVRSYDGKRYSDAKVVGVDAHTDLAVLKIEGDNFSPIVFGDSRDVQVGDIVVSVGSPHGLHQSVSMGVVSAKGRVRILPEDDPFAHEDYIQTDAVVSPGSSGGALVNLRGELVGINAALDTISGGFEGIGFAISVEIVKDVVDSIMSVGTVTRGYIGAEVKDLDDDLARSLGLENEAEIVRRYGWAAENGVFVSEIWGDTPAFKAGIIAGDIITEVGGERVKDRAGFRRIIRNAKVGSVVAVKLVRDNIEYSARITIERQPDHLVGTCYSYDFNQGGTQ